MMKPQHLELFKIFSYDHAKCITWIMVICECFLQNCGSELEPKVLEMEGLTVWPCSIDRLPRTVFAKV